MPAKLKPPLIELNAMNNKPRKRGSNKLNSPNNASRIQQLYNSHNSKANTNLSQRKSVSGSTPSYPTVCSTKAGSVTNRRRKSELLSPNSRAADPSTAVHSTKIAAIADNERQLQEEEVNSVSLQSHKHKFSTTSNDTNVQISAIKPVPAQVRSKTPILPRTSAVSRPSQKQFVYQHHQPYLAPKMAKAMPAIVTAPNATLENSATQSNGTPQSTSQFVSHEVRNALQSTTAPNQRIPPKINILSQQTITKSNINFVPLADNKIIIKSDSKLANAFKSQKIQMIPGQISTVASSTMDGTKMHSQNNLIIRGTSERPMHQPKLFSVPLNSNHRNVQAFYVNMPTSQSPTSIHTIEKVITDETPVDFIANEIDDYIIDETTDTYESVEQSVENTAAYVTTTTHNKIEPIPAKKIKLLSNKEHRASISNASQHFRTHATNNEIVPTIIYEEQQVSTDWDYGVGYKHGGKPNCNGRAIATTDSEVVVEDDTTEYHDSNIIYTEEEVIDDDNVLQEEYVTTEIFPPNGNCRTFKQRCQLKYANFQPWSLLASFTDNVIEMEIDSLIL